MPKERELTVKQEKGVFGGVCGTLGCDRLARWIPVPEGNQGSDVYRCTVCCDAIRAVSVTQTVYAVTFSPAPNSIKCGGLEWSIYPEVVRTRADEMGWFDEQEPGDVIQFHAVNVGPGSAAPPWANTEAMTGYLDEVLDY